MVESHFPLAARWNRPRQVEAEVDEFILMRTNLEMIEPAEINWHVAQPLLGYLNYEHFLSQIRYPFPSFTSWELYMGERCTRQIAGWFSIPPSPPLTTAWLRGDGYLQPVPSGNLSHPAVDQDVYMDWF